MKRYLEAFREIVSTIIVVGELALVSILLIVAWHFWQIIQPTLPCK